jgi:hypothetical protein
MDGTRATAAAGAVHVEEDDAIALTKRGAIDALQRPADVFERAGGYVAWNDRIGHAGEAAMPQVDVGSAHFGPGRAKQRRARRQRGAIEFTNLDGPPRASHHGSEDAITHVVRYP